MSEELLRRVRAHLVVDLKASVEKTRSVTKTEEGMGALLALARMMGANDAIAAMIRAIDKTLNALQAANPMPTPVKPSAPSDE